MVGFPIVTFQEHGSSVQFSVPSITSPNIVYNGFSGLSGISGFITQPKLVGNNSIVPLPMKDPTPGLTAVEFTSTYTSIPPSVILQYI